jgi:Mrp family chromosome partitioning ATPase
MVTLIGSLKRKYDVIIVDSPPLASGGDPLILSSLTGNMAVVIRTGATEKQLAQAKLDQLSGLPIRVIGAILNDVEPGSRDHYYYSTYLPGYEPVPEGEDRSGVQLISGGQSRV